MTLRHLPAALATLTAAALLNGCVSRSLHGPSRPEAADASMGATASDAGLQRMLVWTGDLSLEVGNVSNTVAQVEKFVATNHGYVESRTDRRSNSVDLQIRIPAASFTLAVGWFEQLGTVTHKSINASDVTDQYVDLEARLKAKTALRDRLQQLLQRATEVKDVLAIETELTRLQADLDSMEGRLRVLKSQVQLATLNLHLERRKIPGPLGLVFKAVGWTIGKLFVLRD